MNIEIAFIAVPVLYAIVAVIDFSAPYSRLAGFHLKRNSMGYSIQNLTLAFTRIFHMLLLPLMGFMMDNNVSSSTFYYVCIASLLLGGLFCLMSFLSGKKILKMYISTINKKLREDIKVTIKKTQRSIQLDVFLMGLFVYTIHAISVFLVFYVATVFQEHKIMITHMSGFVTAAATFILTAKLDPLLSFKIERRDGYEDAHFSVLVSRLLALFVASPAILSILHLTFN